ncbi:hypothetical protein L6R52_35830, partial [Myxococcota bacterium]|nr:hypothetical protein [Myxococcota bacterium]
EGWHSGASPFLPDDDTPSPATPPPRASSLAARATITTPRGTSTTPKGASVRTTPSRGTSTR